MGDMVMFIGREWELQQLQDFHERKVAGLAVCRGRRRIGKSSLTEEFARKCKGTRFVEIYGLAPRENITNADQLRHFGELVGMAFNLPAMKFDNWNAALMTLAGLTTRGPTIILLDEISWLASKDKDFAGVLKGVWDTHFKKNRRLTLILCGSVASWIEENILRDKGFMGRVSLTITLDEMSLLEANQFWPKKKRISAMEKLKLLCVTGGVPRYLEEIQTSQSAEDNIQRMCFTESGFLFSEFDKIFNDIFEKRADVYKRIIEALAGKNLETNEICEMLGIEPTGGFSTQLEVLMLSGFISRDYVWNTDGRKTRLSKYRIRDNYLRFYLRYIEPRKDKIKQGIIQETALEGLSEWQTIMGLQFENLVLNNKLFILKKLNLKPANIVFAAPYFQHKTKRLKACQIDLLIKTKFTLYVCEMKFRSKILGLVIDEVEEKVKRLKKPRSTSVRTVLIYAGTLARTVEKVDYFDALICMEELLN